MSFLKELKRRNVFRVAIAYLVIAWLLAQVSATLENALNMPAWFDTMVVSLLLIGFPIALFFAWVFELTPEGIKREKDIDRDESVTSETSNKLNYVTIVAAIAVLGMFVWQQMNPPLDSRLRGNDEIVKVNDQPNKQAVISAQAGMQLDEAKNLQPNNNSIAVLPFAHRSNNDDDLYFTDGIHDDLLTQLAKIKGIKVISRTSVMQFRNTEKTMSEIGAELGVTKILEGGVQRAGARIRINAQLIDVSGAEQHTWAETYDREMNIDNLFNIQSEITTKIIASIKGELTDTEIQQLSKAPTQNIEAYELFLKGRQALYSLGDNIEGLTHAQPFIEKALELDPDFAMAHLLMFRIYSQKSWQGIDVSEENKSNAEKSLTKAAELLPDGQAELLAAQGQFLYRYENDFKAAYELQKKAFAAMPSNADIAGILGIIQRRIGLWNEAVVSLTLADKLNPTEPEWARHLASTLLLSHQYDELSELLVSLRARFPNDSSIAGAEVAMNIFSTGDLITARLLMDAVSPSATLNYMENILWLPWAERDYQRGIDVWNEPQFTHVIKNWGTFSLIAQAEGYLKLDDTENANKLLKKAIAMPIDESLPASGLSRDYESRAWAYSLSGAHEKAIADINKAIEIYHYEDNQLDGLHTLSRKAFILARAGRSDEAIELIKLIVNKPGGFSSWRYYLDPGWDFFRDNEEFNQLIKPDNFDQSIHANKKNQIP
jgi:TolB-like protein/Tfp pilus assembly protein PilF